MSYKIPGRSVHCPAIGKNAKDDFEIGLLMAIQRTPKPEV